jgi:hypothetical protein
MGSHELNRPAYGTFQLNSGRPLFTGKLPGPGS